MNFLLLPTNFYKHLMICFWTLILLYTGYIPVLDAAYIQVFSQNANGGLSFTGNTLGLNGSDSQFSFNNGTPGTGGIQGAFTTVNTSLQVGTFPPGTTRDWNLNSSAAVLDLPPGSTILHAELLWGGTWGFEPAISGAVLDTPITMITPDLISHTITPNPGTAQSTLSPGFSDAGFYTRSADVTSIVTALGAGAAGDYIVGGVPATMVNIINTVGNSSGWTLAVAYENPSCSTYNLNIFSACEPQGAAPAVLSGFQTPLSGSFTSRLFTSSLDGDPQTTGDSYLIGPTAVLSYPTNAISGSNNPINNFFASQINTLLNLTTDITTGKLVAVGSSVLDTRGTFGFANSIAAPPTGVSAARQGYDITSIDLTGQLSNGQTTLYTRAITSFDQFVTNSLGLQIQLSAPILETIKTATPSVVGLASNVNYTVDINNLGDESASSLIFTDNLPTGLSFVPGSFAINAVPVPAADIVTGVPLGTLIPGASITVTFSATVTQINPPTSFDNVALVDYSYIPEGSVTPENFTSQSNIVTVTPAAVAPPIANPDTASTVANTVLNGGSVLDNDTGTSISVSSYDPASVQGGSVIMLPGGTYTYNPPVNFSGIDSFNYTIVDSLLQTSSTTVTITVFPLANPDTGSVAANTPLNQLVSVLSNDFGTSLVVSGYTPATAAGGSVVVQPNGTYVYVPPLNFSGIDSFTYTIQDALLNTSSTIVTISVLPAAVDDFGITPANTTLNGSTVFTNDQGQGLIIIAYQNPSSQGGVVVMNTTTGTYVYTPPLNFSGVDTFTYSVQDQAGAIAIATVRITVLPVAVNDSGATLTNVPLNQAISVLSNDLGTGLTIMNYDTLTVEGGSVVMQTNGTYIYTPPANFIGTDSFNYVAIDSNGNMSGATVVIGVGFNAEDDMVMITANGTLIGQSVLTNDTGTALTVSSFTSPVVPGSSVSMNTDGTYIYIPALNYSGLDSFTYTVMDAFGNTDTGTVFITVTPIAGIVSDTTPENTTLNGSSVLATSIGTGLSIASYQPVGASGGTLVMNTVTGTFTYTPPLNFTGTETFTYVIRDAAGSIAQGTITIRTIPVGNVIFPPTHFRGVLTKHKFFNKTEYCLRAKWDASVSPNVVAYKIYHRGKFVKKISSTDPLIYKKSLKSKKGARRYTIAAVSQDGTESARVSLRLKSK